MWLHGLLSQEQEPVWHLRELTVGWCHVEEQLETLLKRSQSTTFNPDDMSETEFKRGGTRATAGPRLGWSRDLGQSHNELDMPFAKWTKEQVCNWLQDQGLGSYISNGKHWILSGQTLLQASQQDLEKPKKLTFSNFGSLRKKKQDDVEEYVCPMELGRASGSGSKKGFKPGLDIRVYDDDDLDRLEQMEDSEGTVRQIGAFSEGINNLTPAANTLSGIFLVNLVGFCMGTGAEGRIAVGKLTKQRSSPCQGGQDLGSGADKQVRLQMSVQALQPAERFHSKGGLAEPVGRDCCREGTLAGEHYHKRSR
ncbi:liprin-hypothetical protein [Limosa lapponica baueri]|uniref:SAM domain-containing protein n=1 Tax=Limosa lapponica baueri TaxID=1758121 RepID=A0A2I0TKJ3_LIMLA|nr:liprin-hypothetical protein [Limosa lapponica baueri]